MNNKIPKDIATVLNYHFPSANVNITYTSLKKTNMILTARWEWENGKWTNMKVKGKLTPNTVHRKKHISADFSGK